MSNPVSVATGAAAIQPPRSSAASSDPGDAGRAHVYSPVVQAILDGGASYVLAEMIHDGHVGTVDLTYRLSRLNGSTIQEYGPVKVKRFNIWAPNRQVVRNSVQLYPLTDCGQKLEGFGEFHSWLLTVPLPIDLGAIEVPEVQGTRDSKTGYGYSMQSACPNEEGSSGTGGGGGGDGSGYYVTYTNCWGYHLYSGGQYVTSVIEGCTYHSSWISTGGNAT